MLSHTQTNMKNSMQSNLQVSRISRLLPIAALALAPMLAGSAMAVVIDFEGAEGASLPYSEDGFTLTQGTAFDNMIFGSAGDPPNAGVRPSAYFGWDGMSSVVLSSSGPFSIQSFEFGFLNQAWGQGHLLTITGAISGGGTIAIHLNPISTNTSGAFEVHGFDSSWQNLSSVTFTSGDPAIAIDNIRVNDQGRVPDGGSTVALFGLALTSIAAARRKFGRK